MFLLLHSTKYKYILTLHSSVSFCSHSLVLLDVVAVEDFQLALDEVGLIAEHLDLLLVGLDHSQGGFDVLQFGVHLRGGRIDHAAQPGESAGQFLLHLVAAVGRGEVDNQLQLSGCMLHVLVLEVFLLGGVRPG